jgi:TonB family protein
MSRAPIVGLCAMSLLAGAQSTSGVYRAGSGVSAPKVLHRVEPSYTPEARIARIQGIVLLEFVVNEDGRAQDITVLSGIGRGLDEQARRAVSQWEFRPGTKDGKPVKVAITEELVFRFRRGYLDWGAEKRRTEFNVAMRHLGQRDSQRQQALSTIQRLATKNYVPAQYRYAKLLEAGNGFPRDLEKARVLLEKSAAKNYAPSIYDVGRMYLDGRRVAKDEEKGREMIRVAAIRGSTQAQFFLGSAYEAGAQYPQNHDSARQYFKMCATAGLLQCQYRMGRSLLAREGRQERDYVQGIAWLELAAAQGSTQAVALLDAERPKMSEDQIARADEVREGLMRR